ncbi:putative F-box protein [Cardamine amara subsp. amara]|uniref:F-box protein n=1 Tax=Cardamine amara subsp. amara TaxID=228776 RepID=A0ABD1AH74_CARAN
MDQNQREEKMKSRDIDWSEICNDALRLILERLSIADFHRARTACSNWCFLGGSYGYPKNGYPETANPDIDIKFLDPSKKILNQISGSDFFFFKVR